MRLINAKEFFKVRRAMSEATELCELGHYASALAALRPAFQILEPQAQKTRLEALLNLQKSQIAKAMGKKETARHALERAIYICQSIKDTSSLAQQCRMELEQL